jgi:hypothetical protein
MAGTAEFPAEVALAFDVRMVLVARTLHMHGA